MPANEVAGPVGLTARLAAHVREAGTLALEMFMTPMKVWTKEASSPVCEADIAVNRLLRERLAGEAGDIAWLSEESADDPARLHARQVWIVDPIDGTRAYIAGLPDWAVSVALVEEGRPIAACLYAPALGEFFMASAGSGATLNGAPMAANASDQLASARFSGPKSILQRMATVVPQFTIMPRVHSLALRLARIAQGTFDVAFVGGNSHDWDLAAADLLVHEARGALSPIGGGSMIYNRPVPRHGILVAAGRNRHAVLIELLKDIRLALP